MPISAIAPNSAMPVRSNCRKGSPPRIMVRTLRKIRTGRGVHFYSSGSRPTRKSTRTPSHCACANRPDRGSALDGARARSALPLRRTQTQEDLGNALNDAQIARYRKSGYVFPVPGLTPGEAIDIRTGIEDFERRTGLVAGHAIRNKGTS